VHSSTLQRRHSRGKPRTYRGMWPGCIAVGKVGRRSTGVLVLALIPWNSPHRTGLTSPIHISRYIVAAAVTGHALLAGAGRGGDEGAPLMRCPQCQRDNPATARFSNGCGARLEVGCPACDHVNPSGSRFCNGWGKKLDAQPRWALRRALHHPSLTPRSTWRSESSLRSRHSKAGASR
jgi:hypothetical protein